MKNTTKIIALIFLSLLGFTQVSAYEITQNDERLISTLETKIFPILDQKGEKITGRMLDNIDRIQARNKRNERIIAILEQLERDIDSRYDIGKYVVAKGDTPILNSADFTTQFGGEDGVTLNFDTYGEIDAVEHIAIEGTVFEIEEELENNIYKVETNDYPVDGPLYVHAGFFTNTVREKPNDAVRELPTEEVMLEKLRSIVGVDYVWGGNSPEGIPELLSIFPPENEISELKKTQWQLTGVDCSGLLYWASNGNTPRNTSWLVEHGERLDIAGKSLSEITLLLEPLDVIVWKGHMMIVLNQEDTIESAVSYSDSTLTPGVQRRKIRDSLAEVMQKRTPVNNYNNSSESPFVIMRWMK